VDEALGRHRDDYLESCSGGHDGPVLIEDRPLLFICAFVPDAYIMAVGASASGRGASAGTGASPIRGWRDDDDGVGVAVDEGVADVSVVTAAVRVRGGVGECDLAIRFAGVLDGAGLIGAGTVGLAGRLAGCGFTCPGASGSMGASGVTGVSGAVGSARDVLGMPPDHDGCHRAHTCRYEEHRECDRNVQEIPQRGRKFPQTNRFSSYENMCG
jgi:hypothetical protein